jgi:HAD superfamily hydrolase (TIGR01509 family)
VALLAFQERLVIKALIFDFDGLMVDTETPRFEAWRKTYQRFGADISKQAWCALTASAPHFDPCEELERRLGNPVDRAEAVEIRRRISKPITDGKPLLEGVADWIGSAEEAGLTLGVATNSPRSWVDGHLERLGVRDRFHEVRCGEDVEAGKPAPDVYLAALDALAAEPQEALALEDSAVGLRAARAAGIACVAVPNGMTRHLDLSEADLVLGSLTDMSLSEVLEGLGL